jgi:hypothetical protein
MPLSFVGRTSSSAADVLVGLPIYVENRASRTGTSGAAQESRPTIPFRFGKTKWQAGENAYSTMCIKDYAV